MAAPEARRVTLFGGTFDPPHRGHIAIARAAADRFALDQVLFAPAGRQPLKPASALSPFPDRLAMVTLACEHAADPRFIPSALDAPHPDGTPNYTVDTLAQLAALHPRATLFNLIGADNFRHIAHWRNPQRLLALAEWIVISRPGFPLEHPGSLRLTPTQRARIHLLDSVHEDVSATALRSRLRAGEPCGDLIAPAVAAYIAENRLYRP
jgi:nicotinate-nucleotide adenylyltransferase